MTDHITKYGYKFPKGNIPWNKGLTKETDTRVKNSSELNKRHIPWNKGTHGVMKCSDKLRKKRSEISKSVDHPGLTFSGRKHSEATKKKMSESTKGEKNHNYGKISGENNPAWAGGITSIYQRIRGSIEYNEWRKQVFIKNNFKCWACDSSKNINAHHLILVKDIVKTFQIRSFSQALNTPFLWNPVNGITLCGECHNRMHGKKKKK
jgi:hypothetical protein